MGIEVIIGAVAAAASVVTGVLSYTAAAKAAGQQKQSNAISNANQQNMAADSRRQAIRDARIRTASIMQQSENSGVAQSSGSLGAQSVIGTNLGINNSTALQQTTATNGINYRQQQAANYNFQSSMWGDFGNIFSSSLNQFRKPGVASAMQSSGYGY